MKHTKEFDNLNKERLNLIDKKFSTGLTEEENQRLEHLQAKVAESLRKTLRRDCS